ncbi:MAG: C-terminal binding protein [Gemmatimonadota bacterium]|nr:C-terminal binding protein [Gemmatimonadota bacterium]
MKFRVVRPTVFPHAPASMIPEEQRILDAAGAEVVPVTLSSPAELVDHVHGADGLIVPSVPVTARVIEAMPGCRGIVAASIGFDHIDLAAATGRGILVANVPDFCIREVANHTMGLLLTCVRKIALLNTAMHAGRWDRTVFHPMAPIHGETLGLVSFGRIARQVALRARAFELELLAYDPYVDAAIAAEYGVALVPLDELLRRSDYVSVHAPRTASTRHLIGRREIGLMKPTAMLFNTGRGGVIDEAALVAALRAGQIAGAGLDVFEQEPIAPDHPFRGMENVVLTPHAGGYSESSIQTVRRSAAEEMARILTGELPRNLVNPEAAPASRGLSGGK